MNQTYGINENALMDLVKKMLRYHDDINRIFVQYKNIVEETNLYFKGEAAEQYRGKFNKFNDNLNVISNSFLTYIDELNKIIDNYKNLRISMLNSTLSDDI